MLIKIRNGTTVECGEGLCDTCRHSTIIRGRRLEEEIVFCTALGISPISVHFKVTACTDYADRRAPTYHELLHKAWILRPSTARRPAGFVRVSELPGQEAMRLFAEPAEE